MSIIQESTLKKAHKPFDIVTDEKGNVGIIQEVSVNDCQTGFDDQIRYAVEWLVGGENNKHAWFHHAELTVHCNIFIVIGRMACHARGSNARWVKRLMQGET